MSLTARLRRALVLLLLGVVTSCGDATAPAATVYAASPAEARFVTSDIENFWRAYDAFRLGQGSAAFQVEYLDKASPGLRDFALARGVTAASLVQMVNAFPMYFDDIRANTLRLSSDVTVSGRIRQSFEAIEALYPSAVYPPVTFLIGRFSTGGTIRESGMLIGAEFFGVDDDTPLTELGAFQRETVRPLDSLPLIVAHEHVHVLQSRFGGIIKSNATLLEQSLMEGSADFVAELAAGSHPNQHIHSYGLAHEAELWAEFSQAMHGRSVSQWLYNQGGSGGRPGDLGYFIGYRIAQAFYDQASDKADAVKRIIEVRDATAFLAASGYHGGP